MTDGTKKATAIQHLEFCTPLSVSRTSVYSSDKPTPQWGEDMGAWGGGGGLPGTGAG